MKPFILLLIFIFAFDALAVPFRPSSEEFQLGRSTNEDLTITFDIGGGDLPKIRYDSVAGKLLFKNPGQTEKAIGAGGGGESGINSLDNPGFEDGITTDWTCTATKCTEETTSPLNGEKSLIFTPTAQNDEFKSDLKAIQKGLMGRACEARVFYVGGDENLSAEVVDGNGLSLAKIPLVAHPIASYESIFFLCPTETEILGDSLKGDLQLRVYNEQVTVAAAATFDEMRNGDLVGLVEIATPDVVAARVGSTGTVISESADFLSGNCTNPSTGNYSCTFTAGFFSEIPSCTITARNGSRALVGQVDNVTLSGFGMIGSNVSASPFNFEWNIICKKQGADAKQSVQVYKSAPKTDQNYNQFSADIDGGAASLNHENIPWVSGVTSAGVGRKNILVNAGVFSEVPHCICTARTDAAGRFCEYEVTASTTTSLRFATTEHGGSTVDARFNVSCFKRGADVVTPTVQPILVNQVETQFKAGQKVESCLIANSGGTPTIGGSLNTCGWITALQDIAVGQWDFQYNGHFGGQFPVCMCTTRTAGIHCSIENGDGASSDEQRIRIKNSSDVDQDSNVSIFCMGER